PSGGDREHQDPRLAVRADHRGEESDRMPVEVRDEEAVPPPAVDVQIQGGRVVLPQRLADDRCDRGDVVRDERPDAHGAAEGSDREASASTSIRSRWKVPSGPISVARAGWTSINRPSTIASSSARSSYWAA